MIRNLFTVSLVFILAACSGNNKETTVEENAEGIEVGEYNSPVDEIATEEVDTTAEDTEIAEMTETDDAETTPIVTEGEETKETVGEEKTYTVIEGDTLMLISFKVFGDYERWRDIQAWNQDVIEDPTSIAPGTELRYTVTEPVPAWNPEGNPYLIKENDTLGIISNNVYQTPKYWKEIWHNNKPLIKDPNIIFAGFTIYTPIINTVPQSASASAAVESETVKETTSAATESEATEKTNTETETETEKSAAVEIKEVAPETAVTAEN